LPTSTSLPMPASSISSSSLAPTKSS
jgi:hypothetical protein